jgi:hypothetical protein
LKALDKVAGKAQTNLLTNAGAPTQDQHVAFAAEAKHFQHI